MNLSVEHCLMFVLVVCAFYYLMGKCSCRRVEGVLESSVKKCILGTTLTRDYGGTRECLKGGSFHNDYMRDYYQRNWNRNEDDLLNEMVRYINSGGSSSGGWNVANPERCVKAVKECFNN